MEVMTALGESMTWYRVLEALRTVQVGWEPVGYSGSSVTPDVQEIRITVRRRSAGGTEGGAA